MQEQNFLTSGVNAHLGGLGGSEQSHLTVFFPYSPLITFSPYMSGGWVWGEKKWEIIDIETIKTAPLYKDHNYIFEFGYALAPQ